MTARQMIAGRQSSEDGDCPGWLQWFCDLFGDDDEPAPWKKEGPPAPNVPSTPPMVNDLGELEPVEIFIGPVCGADGTCEAEYEGP
jgi:hypothetical protein